MECKWGEKPEYLKNSSAWLCMFKIPLSLVAMVGTINYSNMQINTVLCTEENCRCFKAKPADIIREDGSKICGIC